MEDEGLAGAFADDADKQPTELRKQTESLGRLRLALQLARGLVHAGEPARGGLAGAADALQRRLAARAKLLKLPQALLGALAGQAVGAPERSVSRIRSALASASARRRRASCC